jgi:hypothetical protein
MILALISTTGVECKHETTYFGVIGIKVGDEFLFNFGSPFKTSPPLCYTCMISGPLPPVMQEVKDVQIIRGKD